MKIKLLSSLVISSIAFSTVPAFADSSAKLTKKDNEALSWLMLLDHNEIDAAKVTLKKAHNTQVRQFANFMIKEHTQNLQQAQAFNSKLKSSPEKSKDYNELKVKGQEVMKQLDGLKGKEFEEAYVTDMVKGHTEALETLDQDFLNNVDNQKVKTFLNDTRIHVSNHLEQAKALENNMKG